MVTFAARNSKTVVYEYGFRTGSKAHTICLLLQEGPITLREVQRRLKEMYGGRPEQYRSRINSTIYWLRQRRYRIERSRSGGYIFKHQTKVGGDSKAGLKVRKGLRLGKSERITV